MAALTDAQKKKIRKELQRLAQAKQAWKAGGGTKKQSASMKGWSGFGQGGASKADQLAYINSLNTSGTKSGGSLTKNQQSKWKTSYQAAAKKNVKKGAASVKEYIKKKGGNTATQGTSPSISKNKKTTTTNKNTTTKTGFTSDQKKWYAKHRGKGKSDAFLKKTLKAKIKKGLL